MDRDDPLAATSQNPAISPAPASNKPKMVDPQPKAPTAPAPRPGARSYVLRFISGKYQGGEFPIATDKQILVGVIDVANCAVESSEQVAATIDAALAHADKERIQACTNCGLAPLPKTVAEGKIRALGAGAAVARRRHAA